MYKSNPKFSKLLILWFEIIFYTLLITIVMTIVFSDISGIENFINAIFPISSKQYWYLSAYFGLYICIPILNLAINKLEQIQLKNIFLYASIMMLFMPILFNSNPYNLEGGYSVAWLCLLYLLGGYINRYNILEKIKAKTALIIFSTFIFLTFLSKIVIEYSTKHIFGISKYGNTLISYISPTIVIASLFLFIFFSNIHYSKLSKKSLIENGFKLLSIIYNGR